MSETFHQAFGRCLAVARRRAGMMQKDLANVSGFSKASINGIERGRHRVALQDAAILAKAVGSDLVTLIGDAPLVVPTRANLGGAKPGRRAATAISASA